MRKTQSLHDLLHTWMKNSGKEELFYQLRIKDFWQELLGKKIASKTQSIDWVKEEQILLIKISDPLLRNELHYAKEAIKEKLEEAIPDISIQKVIIM